MFSLGAFGILFDQEGRVLLSHRRDLDIWNLPGGAVEPGELPTQAVVREVAEETGLEVEVTELVGVYGKAAKAELVFAFGCRVVGGHLRATLEADRHAFFPLDQLPQRTIPKHVERIHDAAARRGQPLFRIQQAPSTQEMLSAQGGASARATDGESGEG